MFLYDVCHSYGKRPLLASLSRQDLLFHTQHVNFCVAQKYRKKIETVYMEMSMDLLISPSLFCLTLLAVLSASTACGATFIAFCSEVHAYFSKKIFYKKFSEQMSIFALGNLLFTTLCGALCLSYLILQKKNIHAAFLGQSPLALVVASVGFTLFMLALLKGSRTGKNNKGHLLLTSLAALACLITLISSLAAVKYALYTAETPALQVLLFPPLRSMHWPVLLLLIILFLIYGSGIGLSYLFFRRKRDDFGRDYYNFALLLALRWAIGASLALLIFSAWIWASSQVIQTAVKTLSLYELACCGLFALCFFSWLFSFFTKKPLQAKIIITSASVLLCIIYCLAGFAFRTVLLL